ncbi:unnamed protein product [Gulo gulo]|uniref:Uncharacterized protein n=1 Tax=Gulo gulo TaxID=48420 RepID=A0A9X9LYG6_GULGU|nr:unnamed protein product [Gulo gulo]
MVQILGLYLSESPSPGVSVRPVLRVWNLAGVSVCRIHSPGFGKIEKGHPPATSGGH